MSLARRSLQVVAFVCTLIVGVASMAVIITQTTWFKEWLRGFIVRQAEDYVNGRLSIGRLDGNLFFGVDLEDVDVTMNGKSVVDVKNVGLDYNAMTLIKGDVVLDSIKIERPILRLEQTAEGWNLANLIKTKTPDNPNNKRTLEIGEIGVADATVYVDSKPVGTSGVTIPERIDRIDASVGVKSNAKELAVDVNHVSLRAANPQFGVNALSGVIRKSDTEIDFDNVALRTEETSLQVNGTIKNLDSKTPVLSIKASSDKFAVNELAKIVPALRGYDLQPAFELTAIGPADNMALSVNAREKTVGNVVADLKVDALDPQRRIAGTAHVTHLNVGPVAKSPTLKSDITGQARFDVALPSDRLPMRGTYAVNAERVQVIGYEARNVVANGRIDGETLTVNAKAVAYGGNATTAGTVKMGEPLALDLHGQAARLDLRNLPPSLNAPGVPSNLQFAYTVKSRGPVFSGSVRMQPSTLAGATIARGTTAEFTIGNGAPTYAASGEVSNLDLQQVGRGFNIPALTADRYRSRVNASFNVKGSGGGRYPLSIDADGMVVDSELFGASFPRLSFATSLSNGDARVTALGQFANLDPALVSGNERIAGKLSGSIDIMTTIRQYGNGVTPESIDASGHIDLADSAIGGVQIDSAVVQGEYANREGRLDQLSIVGADVNVSGQGPIALNETGSSNVQLHVETPSLERVGKLINQPLTGGVVVDAYVTGNGNELYVDGTLQGSNLGQGENNALSLTSTFDVSVPQLDAQRAAVHASNEATFVQVGGQKINQLLADVTYGQSKVYFSATAKQEQRQLDAGGTVALHPDHQEIHLPDLALRTQQIEWRTAPGSEAAIRYGNDRIAVDNMQLVSGDQRITANGVVGSSTEALKVQAENVDVAQLNQLALGQPGQVSGRLNANATITGSTSDPHVAGEFALTQGAFRQFKFESLGGKVDYAQPGVTLDVKLQQNPNAWLTAKGVAPVSLLRPNPPEMGHEHQAPAPGEAIDIQVQSSPIDLGLIQGFTSSVSNVMGTLQANFKVTGSGYDPHLDGAIEVRNGAFAVPDLGTSYTGLDTRIDLKPDAVTITEMRILDNHGNPMTIGGELAVHERSVGGVNVNVKSDNFKVIDNKMGNVRVNTDLRLTGEVIKPRLEGTVALETGQVDVAELLQQFGKKAYATEATELPFEDANTAAQKVRSNADIPADANTRTPNAGADTAPNVAAVAKEAQEKTKAPEITPQEQPNVFNALALNVKVSVPDDLVLKGQDIRTGEGGTSLGNMSITVGGDVDVTKDPGDTMRLRGEIRTIRGYYTFQGRRFELLRDGRIRFVGTDEINPLLDLQARRVIQGVEAFINVRGTMTMPELSFRSNPPLEEADILSLIIFNQPVNELGEGQQASLAQRAGDLASGYVASGLARSIGTALNLNEFEIQAQGENGAGPSVMLGQQVGKNLFFRMRQGFGSVQSTEFILEYQLRDYLRLQATAAETSGGTQRIQFRRVERGGLDLIFFFAY